MKELTRGIHLDRCESLRDAIASLSKKTLHIIRLVPTDPPVYTNAVADLPSEQLPDRHTELAAFDVP